MVYFLRKFLEKRNFWKNVFLKMKNKKMKCDKFKISLGRSVVILLLLYMQEYS